MSIESLARQGDITAAGGRQYSEWHRAWHRLKRGKPAMFGLGVLIFLILASTLAPWLAPHDPYEQNLVMRFKPIGTKGHPLGTDSFGRDMLSRLLYGSRISLVVGLSSVTLGLVFGVTLGLIAGYYRRLDNLIMRVIDVMLAFPGVLLAIAVVAALGPGMWNVVIAIGIWSIPTFARIVRGQVLAIKDSEYITATKAMGCRDGRILVKHILPNCLAPVIVYATMRIASSIMSAATLSFLGLGAQPPIPEWGAMIAEGRSFLYNAPHIATVPGLAIMLVVFAFNLLGDGLRDALDPNLKDV
ncbi:MAG: ABC transporter permease [Firmicutes bacterium]|nr:ABC transporter permease [Bacillota bacterium]